MTDSATGNAKVAGTGLLRARAVQQTGLSDFGDEWLFENLEALIPALNEEARLTPAGVAGAEAMILRALSNRLAHVHLIRTHPEILEEPVEVAAIVAGLPRTGSTMLHRMLASAPGMTGMRWWEAQNYAPPPGTDPHDPQPRRAAAQQIMEAMLAHAPELMSIHPMSIDQPDEEVIVLGQLFSGTMLEGTYYVPSYAAWLMRHSRTRAYADLREILQSLQWQDPSRRGAQWVLKTPGHLMALDAALEIFPRAKIVMTHRDPVATVPSYASMEAVLYAMGGAEVAKRDVARFWEARLAELLGLFMQARDAAGPARFIDVLYPDLTARPLAEGERVLREAGVAVSPEMIAGMEQWIEANRREDRAPHRYTPEEFGLEEAEIKQRFAAYRARFLG